MPLTVELSVRPDLQLETKEDGTLFASGTRFGASFGQLHQGLEKAIRALFEGPVPEDRLLDLASEEDPLQGTITARYMLRRLDSQGVLCRTLCDTGGALVTIVPTAPRQTQQAADVDLTKRHILSRFTYLRRSADCLRLESPLSPSRLEFHRPEAASVACALMEPRTVAELLGSLPRVSAEVVETILKELVEACLAVDHSSEDLVLRPWEFHDLLFHRRTRLGWHSEEYGGTYRFESQIDPLPATKAPMSKTIFPLDKPDLEQLAREDVPFSVVHENRSSIREHGEDAINKKQLGEFLYRCCRTLRTSSSEHGEVSWRPYPGGGAIQELEIYPAIDRCAGLDSGLYQYLPAEHALCQVTERSAEVERLLEDAWLTTGRVSRPQILLLIAARFGRISWKYESVAYALILKDVGVLFQTMYLVATSMNLAPCALGGGNSELFARASGLDPLVEGAVGEFLLGTRQDQGGEQ